MTSDNKVLINAKKQFKKYRGNADLKRAGETIEWTTELVAEFIKCSQDPIYFCEKYVKVIHPDDGKVPFKPRDYQKDMILSMAHNRFTIMATARQVGKSTTTVAFLLWYIVFNQNKTVAILANKGDTAREILGKLQLAYLNLPKWLQPGIVDGGWNKGSIALENGSRALATNTSTDGIRGYTINVLMLDEAAFIENFEEFTTSIFPTITASKESKIIMVSTPNGMNGFYNYWNGAIQNKNGYNPILVNWDQVPGRDKAWYDATLSSMNGDIEKFNQEYAVEFLGSSGTLIAGWKLKELMKSYGEPINKSKGLTQYVYPEKGRKYVIVADVSQGKGLDYSAAQVIDITSLPYQQVCTFRDNFTLTYDFAEILHRLCKAYNDAFLLIENKDIGHEVCYILHDNFEYENLLWTQSAGRAGKRISAGFKTGAERGINTSKTVKSVGCSMIKQLVEQQKLNVVDFHTVAEFTTFSKYLNSYEAEEGHHDDLVMCLVLFGWLTNQGFFKEHTEIDTLSNLKEINEEQMNNDMIPFGFVNDNTNFDDERVAEPTSQGNWLFPKEEQDNDQELLGSYLRLP